MGWRCRKIGKYRKLKMNRESRKKKKNVKKG